MDIVVKFQGLCHVEIRRLMLMIAMVVVVIVVFQCFSLSKSLFPSLNNESSAAMMVSNASVVNSSKSIKIDVAAANDKETDVDYELSVGVEDYHDDFFHKFKDENSQREFTFKKGATHGNSLIMGYLKSTGNSSTETKAMEDEHGYVQKIEKVESSSEIDDDEKARSGLTLGGVRYRPPGNFTMEVENFDANSRTSERTSEPDFSSNLSSVANVKQTIETQLNNPEQSPAGSSIMSTNVTTSSIPMLKILNKRPISISQMNLLLLQSHVSPHSPRPLWSSVRDRELLSAKVEIENAPIIRNTPELYASVFLNVSMFERSYELMERILKVYVYKEGEKPIFHQPQMKGIYASEGWFMKLIERNRKFVARDPRKAHLFYLPFSAKMLRREQFRQNFVSLKDLENHLKNYVELIARKHRFWNRTGGADHFVVACHDWGPRFTSKYMRNCIRALCNANAAKGFKIGMDTTLPVTYMRSAQAPLEELGGKPPLERSTLAFFAGSMHGYLRPILLDFWENKAADTKIFGPMPRDREGKRIYREHMKSSKYCICARGYEVHTPRVVEAIFYECVPVIISDNYVPPFFEVLNWEAFSVFIQEKDIPNLRNILLSISEERYLSMQSRVKTVQKYFLWHKKPEKYDLFHMILHSIWYNRVFNIKTI